MKTIYQYILKISTILIIRKYKPFIIAVTGSVGKTSTKESIFDAFSGLRRVRRSSGNLNTEIGAPLVFFGEKKAGKNLKEWIFILLKGIWLLIKRDKKYPEIVVVEVAADKPGDIKYLSSFIKPNIGIVTAIGEIPVHVEFYKNVNDVAKEKEELVRAVQKNGVAVLNFDDPLVLKMKSVESGENIKNITFGFQKGADVLIKDFNSSSFEGSLVTIEYKGEDFEIFLSDCIGDSFAYIAASVFAVGVSLGVEPRKIPDMVKKIRPAKGRLHMIKGKKDTIILDGSYNAAPSSVASALRSLQTLPGERKIAVLGDMKEIGKYSKEEHRKAGQQAAAFCDYIFSIGEWSHEVCKAAILAGMDKNCVAAFPDVHQAILELEKIISPKDVILVKGSQGTRTEKLVFSLMRDPERAEELLVRQDPAWKQM